MGFLGAVAEVTHKVLELLRAMAAYLAFMATLATSLVLLLKRDFVGAALAALAEVFDAAEDMRRHAEAIVDFWMTHITMPAHQFVVALVQVDIQVQVVEALTLIGFALGPVIRAVWTENARRGHIRQRIKRVDALISAREEQSRQIAAERQARNEVQEAIKSKNWGRAKSALGILGGLALGAMSVLTFNLQHAGSSVMGAKEAYKNMSRGSEQWKALSEEVARLNASIAQRTSALHVLAQTVEALLAADGGFLRSLEGKPPMEVRQAIRTHVAERMRLALAISRVSIGLVAAVLGAHLIDWVL